MKILGDERGGATSAPVQEGSAKTQQTEKRSRKGIGMFKRFATYFGYSAAPAEIVSPTHFVQSRHKIGRPKNCVYVRTGRNMKYAATKKNGGVIPRPKDERLKAIPIKCGTCIECRKEKARNWQIRLEEELKENRGAKFMTMTFSDEFIRIFDNDESENAKECVRRFFDRWKHEKGATPKHWLITEKGQKGSERIHIHGFIWTDLPTREIERIWSYGWVDTGSYVNESSIAYCVKYVFKYDEKHPGFNPKIFASKGLGKGLIEKLKEQKYNRLGELEPTIQLKDGTRVPMPEYLKREVFTDDEREQIRLKQLDKGELFIQGVCYDVKTEEGRKSYLSALDRRRDELSKMGYAKRKKSEKIDEKNLKYFDD